MATKNQNDVIHSTFTAGQAAKASGVAYCQINYWANTGFIVPSIQKARGSNTCRVYSFRDLVALRVAGRLREAGIALSGLRKVVKKLLQLGYDNPLADAYLLVPANGDVAVVEGDKLISLLKKPGQTWFVFALSETVSELIVVAKTLERPTRGKASKVA
jgi:DNA-binding transcriptional MerR regulator